MERQPKPIDTKKILEDEKSQLVNFIQSDKKNIVIEAASQEKGIKNLKDYLRGLKSFSEIQPFVIHESHGHKKKLDEFYVCTINNKSVGFHVNEEMKKIFSEGRAVLALPNEDNKKLYQWLDFYEIDSNENTGFQNIIHSCRVDIKNLKIDSQYWFGLGRQLLLDYLSGNQEIEPDYFQEFTTLIQQDRCIEIGFASGKHIEIYIGNTLCKPGQEIISRPISDPLEHHTWLEGYVRDEEGLVQVYSRRFYKGDLKLYEKRDSAIEVFSDWLKGIVPFEEAEPLTVVTDNKSNGIFLANKFIRFGHQVKQGDNVVIIPQKDELYEWIDIKKKGKEDEDNLISVSSYRLTREGTIRLDGHWPGPERQRWIDYLEEKQDFSILGSLSDTVDVGYDVTLFTWRGRRMRLTLKKNIFTPGEQIRITPYLTRNNNLLLEVSSFQNVSNINKYIVDKHSFSIKALPDEFDQSEDCDSLPHADKSTGAYEDDDKENWSPIGLLHVKLNVANKTITKYCASARKLKGYDCSGHLTELYSEVDVTEILRANNLLGKEKTEEAEMSISSERIKEVFDMFFENP